MKDIITRSALFVLAIITFSNITIAQCPDYGSATDPADRALNKGKNKSVTVPSSTLQHLPLNMLITTSKKNDENRYQNGAYVYTEGYLVSYEEQGPESCNCNKASKAQKNGDVHIYLGLIPNAPKKNCIVVEITPKYKKVHPNYGDVLLPKTRVRVEGYLLFDFEHKGNAVNTCQSCGNVWRKTCWEIHPVTNISQVNLN